LLTEATLGTPSHQRNILKPIPVTVFVDIKTGRFYRWSSLDVKIIDSEGLFHSAKHIMSDDLVQAAGLTVNFKIIETKNNNNA
jgi:hypothetical protein